MSGYAENNGTYCGNPYKQDSANFPYIHILYCITTDDRLLKHGPDCQSFKCINNQNFTSTGQKNTNCIAIELLFLYILFGLRWRFPLYPEILQFYTIILQRIRIIAVDAGCDPGVSVSEVWRATNEPPHLLN